MEFPCKILADCVAVVPVRLRLVSLVRSSLFSWTVVRNVRSVSSVTSVTYFKQTVISVIRVRCVRGCNKRIKSFCWVSLCLLLIKCALREPCADPARDRVERCHITKSVSLWGKQKVKESAKYWKNESSCKGDVDGKYET